MLKSALLPFFCSILKCDLFPNLKYCYLFFALASIFSELFSVLSFIAFVLLFLGLLFLFLFLLFLVVLYFLCVFILFAHPNLASSLQNEVLRIGLNGKGWGWVDWAGFGVEQIWVYQRPVTIFKSRSRC